jgi:hypothetical protein
MSIKQMKLVIAYGKKLLSILIAQDKQLFKDERARRMNLIQFNSGFKGKTDDEKDSSMEEMSQKLQKEGKPASAADLAFKYRQELLLSMRGVISEFRTYNVFRYDIVHPFHSTSFPFPRFTCYLSIVLFSYLGVAH